MGLFEVLADCPLEEVKTAGKRPGHACESPAQMGEIVTGEGWRTEMKVKRELPSQNGKVSSKNGPKMKTNENKKKRERRRTGT